MKFRTGLIIGLAVGYYLGTKAGRERYEQIERMLDRVRRSGTYQQLEHKVSDLAEEGKNKAMDLVDHLVEDEHPMAESSDRNPMDHPAELFADPRLN